MPSTAAPTALHWSTHLKWMGFRALEALSDLRGNAAAGRRLDRRILEELHQVHIGVPA